MANSGTVTAGSAALASQYNNLRDDVLNVSTGHTHTGASENGAKVAATGVSSGTAANGAVLTADGSGAAAFLAIGASGGILKYQEFTSSGSFVIPATASSSAAIVLEVIGAGGGGHGGGKHTSAPTLARGGAGGAGGGYGAYTYPAVAFGTAGGTVTVTIGAGGAGGLGTAVTSTGGNTGSDGGVTSFGSATFYGAIAGRNASEMTPSSPFGLFTTYGNTTATGATSGSVIVDFGINNASIQWGGHGGVRGNSGAANSGFDNSLGGGGGGGGGFADTVIYAGGKGGKRIGFAQAEVVRVDQSTYITFGNGVAGGTANAGSGAAGAGAAGTAGGGGGGGGGAQNGDGGVGGAGAQPGGGGGGGGGSSGSGTSGAGGVGGSGRVRVWVIG